LIVRRPRGESAGARAEAGRQEPEIAQRVEALETRLRHLEAMLEGLQDSVHRESVRQGKKIDELERNSEPAAIRRALGRDAQEHGL
jgi:hypothetical protein